MSEGGYKIDLFEPGDAAGVVELFKEVYGDGYPIKIVYNPEQLVTAFQNGEYIPLLARTPDNRIVGYTALYRSAPHKGLYESGQTLVLPDYRKTPVAGLLFRHTMRVAQKLSSVGLFNTALRTLDALHLAIASTEGLIIVTVDKILAKSVEMFCVEAVVLE
ncbi:MAG: hypothetical protein NT178_18725 [Proteobacteria bacterium]|nr:hypothetical protein [Pseudomonadota bacterium]